jgi:DNA polymerase I-like protein with 3'-5' exonuclease and polymerase domains
MTSAHLEEAGREINALFQREMGPAVDMSVPLTPEVKKGNRW